MVAASHHPGQCRARSGRKTPTRFDVLETKISFPFLQKPLPAAEVLRLMLLKVATGNATFLIKHDYLEVTTFHMASRVIGLPVFARFDKVPLEDALAELADQTGATILVDPRVGDKARSPVSANLRNTISLETAARLLAATAGLQVIADDGTLFLTAKAAGPKTTLEFRKQRIDRALAELADWAEVTIILDPKVPILPSAGPEEKHSMLVTAKLRPNVSPESAVCVLADMVGLRVIARANCYFVTTREKAQGATTQGK